MKQFLLFIFALSLSFAAKSQNWSPVYFSESEIFQNYLGEEHALYLDTLSFSGDTLVGIFMLRTMEDVECPSGSNCYPECVRLGAVFSPTQSRFLSRWNGGISKSGYFPRATHGPLGRKLDVRH